MARFIPNPRGPLIQSELKGYKGVVAWWDRTRPPIIEPHVDDEKYIVKQNDRVEDIAFRKLTSTRYGWVINRRNGIHCPELELVPGCPIFIPTLQSLREREVIRA